MAELSFPWEQVEVKVTHQLSTGCVFHFKLLRENKATIFAVSQSNLKQVDLNWPFCSSFQHKNKSFCLTVTALKLLCFMVVRFFSAKVLDVGYR